MSARITISYETEQELRELTNILSPVMKKCKISKQNNGGYRKAYIELKTYWKDCLLYTSPSPRDA